MRIETMLGQTRQNQLELRLVKRIGELDPNQWATLIHACRAAKETLLSSEETDRQP